MSVSVAELFISVGADVSAAIAGLTALGTQIDSTKTAFERAAPAADLLVGAGLGIVAGLGAAANAAANFESKLTAVRNNTTQTDSDMAAMRETVLKLGAQAPVALDNLAEGFMHVSNFGFSAADSAVVLEAAMRSAVSTGGNTAATAEVLAAILHEFGLNASEAARTMDVLHIASAEGNLTLEQFSQSFGQVAAWAAAVGVPLEEAAAAMSAMTRHGFDAATAATQVKDQIEHLINPSQGAQKALAGLAQASGVDLTNAMSSTNLHARGLVGVMDQIKGAMDKAGLTADQQTSLWLKLIPNIRGGAAAFVLAGRGADDLKSILDDERNSLGSTDAAWERIQKTLGFQWGVLTNLFTEMGIAIGNVLLPVIESGVGIVSGFVKAFLALPEPAQKAAVQLTAIAGVAATLIGGFVLLAPFISAVGPAFIALGDAIIAIAPLLLRLAGAAGILFAIWQVNLFGVRDLVQAAFARIPDVLATISTAFANAGTLWENSILPALQAIANVIEQRVIPIFNAISAGPLGQLAVVFQKVFAGDIAGAVDTFQAIIGAIAPGLGRLVVNIRSALGGFFDTLGPILGNIGLVFEKVFAGDFAGAADTFRAIIGAISPEFGTFIDRARALADAVGPVLGRAFETVGTFLSSEVVPRLRDVAENILPFLQNASRQVGEFWETRLGPAFQAVANFIATEVAPRLQKFAEEVIPFLIRASIDLRTFWDTQLGPAAENIANFFAQNVGPAFETLSAALGNIRTAGEGVINFINPLAEAFASFAGGVGSAVVKFFRDDLPPALAAVGTQVQSLGPLFGSLGEFFGAVTNLAGALGTIGGTALQGLFQNVLVPGFTQLAQALGPIQPTLGAASDAISKMASGFTTIGALLQPVTDFFNNAAKAINALADALARPELAPLLTPGSGARLPGVPGATEGGGPNGALQAAAGAALGSANPFGPLVNIGSLIISSEAEGRKFIQDMANAVAAAAGRVNVPPDNSGNPQLAVATP